MLTDVSTMSIECFIIATECVFSRNKGNSALIAAGEISVVWILAWHTMTPIHSWLDFLSSKHSLLHLASHIHLLPHWKLYLGWQVLLALKIAVR